MQRIVIWAWVAAVAGAGIYPPWITRGGTPYGYGWIFSPGSVGASHVDSARLLIEWVIATAVAFGAYVMPQRQK